MVDTQATVVRNQEPFVWRSHAVITPAGGATEEQKPSGIELRSEQHILGKVKSEQQETVEDDREQLLPIENKPEQNQSAQAVQSSALLKLPGELRNIICRHALIKPEVIKVERIGYSINEIGLLGTCKQIRTDALEICYMENTFVHNVRDYNSEVLVRWSRTSLPLHYGFRKVLKCKKVSRTPSWKNLLGFLELVHATEYYSGVQQSPVDLKARGSMTLWRYVMGGMFETARLLRAQPWTLVKSIMETNRPTLAMIDKRWGNDE